MHRMPRLRLLSFLFLLAFPIIGLAQSADERANQAFDEAVKLHGDKATLRQAIPKYETAISDKVQERIKLVRQP